MLRGRKIVVRNSISVWRLGYVHGRALLTEDEVADALRVSKVTVHRLRARRQLAWQKIGGQVRVSALDLESYLDRTRVRAVGESAR
jgi:excisionase family DNA binding protein